MSAGQDNHSGSFAAVLDVEALLRPISESSPAGEQDAELYTEVSKLREQKNWGEIVRRTSKTLAERAKDLKLGVSLAEASVRTHGLVGLRDSLRLLRGLHERYWEQFYPSISGRNDLSNRANALDLLDNKGGRGVVPALREWFEAHARDAAAVPPGLLAECREACEGFKNLAKAKYGERYSMRALVKLSKLLDEHAGTAAPAAEEAGPVDEAVAPVRIKTRAEALQCLRVVAEYFGRAEPLSPVTYLIRRSVSWAEMTNLEEWLQEVVKSKEVMKDLGHVLGFEGEAQEEQKR